MKLPMPFAFAALLLLTSTVSQAETVTYRSFLLGKPVTLSLDLTLPGAVATTTTPPLHDPEMGDIPGSVSIESVLGSATLTYDSATLHAPLLALGENTDHGLRFHFEAYFPLRLEGAVRGGALIWDGTEGEFRLSSAQNQILSLRLPAQFSAPWELEGNYPTYDIHRGKAPIVVFTR